MAGETPIQDLATTGSTLVRLLAELIHVQTDLK